MPESDEGAADRAPPDKALVNAVRSGPRLCVCVRDAAAPGPAPPLTQPPPVLRNSTDRRHRNATSIQQICQPERVTNNRDTFADVAPKTSFAGPAGQQPRPILQATGIDDWRRRAVR